MKKLMSMLLVVIMLVSLSSVVADMQTDMKMSKLMLEFFLIEMGKNDSINEMLQTDKNEITLFDDSVVVCLTLSPWGQLAFSMGKEETNVLINTTWNTFYKLHKEFCSSDLLVMYFDSDDEEVLYTTNGTHILNNVMLTESLNSKYN